MGCGFSASIDISAVASTYGDDQQRVVFAPDGLDLTALNASEVYNFLSQEPRHFPAFILPMPVEPREKNRRNMIHSSR